MSTENPRTSVHKRFTARVAFAVAGILATGFGAAYAADLDWYEGGNAAVADPDAVTTLKFYDANGAVVTSGSTSDQPFAAYAAADADVHAGATHGTLFAYTPSGSVAPGAWSGAQISDTTRFAGTGAVTGPGAVAGKQFHQGVDSDESLADFIATFPNSATGNLANVFEIRLRTSSDSGVDEDYASAFVKVNGTTWTQIAAPTLGGGQPAAVATTVVPGDKAITAGTATSIPVTVTPASGTTAPAGKVELWEGASKLSEAALSGGATNLPVGASSLSAGTHTLTFSFVPTDPAAFLASQAARNYTVGSASTPPPAPKPTATVSFTFVKKPTSTKGGSLTVTVTGTDGAPTGSVTITYQRVGTSAIKSVTVPLASGSATVPVKKLKKGKWSFAAKYSGDGRYDPVQTAYTLLKVKR